MAADGDEPQTERIEIRGELDHHAAAALQLEIRRLAKEYGVDIVELRCDKDGAQP